MTRDKYGWLVLSPTKSIWLTVGTLSRGKGLCWVARIGPLSLHKPFWSRRPRIGRYL